MAIDDRTTGPQGPVAVTPYVLGRDGKLRGPQPGNPPAQIADSAALTANVAMQSTGDEGVITVRSDTPLPLKMADPAIFSNWDQPQPPLPQRSPPFVSGGPAEPPFPPPTNNGHAIGIGVAGEVGVGVAHGGEAPDIAQFVGHVTTGRTLIIRTVLNNRVAVQLSALSLLAALDLKIDTLRAGGSNSEITAFDDLKHRVEEFLAANEKAEETAIADTTLSIADGLRRYRTEKYENICDVGLLGIGLSFCAAAGALGVSDTNILAVTALAGGDRVVGVVKAAADLVWGKGDKS
jgi:hypothetical protein